MISGKPKIEIVKTEIRKPKIEIKTKNEIRKLKIEIKTKNEKGNLKIEILSPLRKVYNYENATKTLSHEGSQRILFQ